RSSADGAQGVYRAGSGTHLCAGTRALPAGGGNAPALPGLDGAVGVLSGPGRVADRLRAGRAAPAGGPERPRSRPPPGGALCPGGYPVLAGRVAPGARAFGAESSPLQSAAAPCPRLSLWGGRRGVFPRLYVLAPVVARLSAAGGAAEPA